MEDRSQHQFADAGVSALFDMGFRRFITLSIIKVLYALGILLIALIWLVLVIGAFTQGATPGIIAFFIGTLAAAIYLIFFRVWLELIVVIFRIGENTSVLVEQGMGGSASR